MKTKNKLQQVGLSWAAAGLFTAVFSFSATAQSVSLMNPGFESGNLNGWDNWGNAVVLDGGVLSGKYTTGIGPAAGGFGQIFDISKMQKGKTYHFQVYARTGSSSDTSGFVGIEFLNGRTSLLKKSLNITATTYTAYKADVVVPQDATSVKIYTWKNAGPSRIYVDQYSLALAGSTTEPVPQQPVPQPTPQQPAPSTGGSSGIDPDLAKRLQVYHEYIAGQPYTRWWSQIHGGGIPRGASVAVTKEYGLPALVFKYPRSADWSTDNMRRAQLRGQRVSMDSPIEYKIVEGTTRYQGLRILMPPPQKSGGRFLNIFSHTTDRGSSGAQNLGLPNGTSGTPGIYMPTQYGNGPTLGPIPHPGSRWIDIITRVTYLQAQNGTGTVELYWKWSDTAAWTKAGSSRGETFGSPTSANVHRIGIYSDSATADYVVAFSKVVIGSTFDDVANALGVLR